MTPRIQYLVLFLMRNNVKQPSITFSIIYLGKSFTYQEKVETNLESSNFQSYSCSSNSYREASIQLNPGATKGVRVTSSSSHHSILVISYLQLQNSLLTGAQLAFIAYRYPQLHPLHCNTTKAKAPIKNLLQNWAQTLCANRCLSKAEHQESSLYCIQ